MKSYRLLKQGNIIESHVPGQYAGNAPGKIFGTLDCESGKKMKKENRVFFHTLEEAVTEEYRPCKNCRPIAEDGFESIRHLVPYRTLEEFYNRDKK